MWRFPKMENSIGIIVIKILIYKQKNLPIFYIILNKRKVKKLFKNPSQPMWDHQELKKTTLKAELYIYRFLKHRLTRLVVLEYKNYNHLRWNKRFFNQRHNYISFSSNWSAIFQYCPQKILMSFLWIEVKLGVGS